MPMRPTDPLLGPTRGDLVTALAAVHARTPANPDDVDAFLNTVNMLAPQVNIPFDEVVAKAVNETNWFANQWWAAKPGLNAGSLGITGDPAQDAGAPKFATGEEAARAMLAHWYAYAVGDPASCPVPELREDPRRQALIDAGFAFGSLKTLADFGGTWAAEADDGASTCEKGNAIWPNLPDVAPASAPLPPPPGTTPQVSSVPVHLNILPSGSSNRPGTKLNVARDLYVVVHESGDERAGADAAAEIAYLQTAEAQQRQVSFHLSVDDHQVVQGLPLDEVGWHCGDGCADPATDYCHVTIGIEGCVNADGDETRMRRNFAQVIARVCAGDGAFDWGAGGTRGKFSTDRIKEHIQVSTPGPEQHHCPDHMLNEGFFGTFLSWVGEAAGALPAPAAPLPTPKPVPPSYAVPDPTPVTGQNQTLNGHYHVQLPAGAQVTVTAASAATRQYGDPRSALVAPGRFAQGTAVPVDFVVVGTDNQLWYEDAAGRRIAATDCGPLTMGGK